MTPPWDVYRHGVHVVTPPWAWEKSCFTLLMESYAMLLMREMAIAKVREALRISHSALTRILRCWVMDAVDRTDLSEVNPICIDAAAHKKRQKYVTLVVGAQQCRVIDAEEGRDAAAVEAFAAKPEKKGDSSLLLPALSILSLASSPWFAVPPSLLDLLTAFAEEPAIFSTGASFGAPQRLFLLPKGLGDLPEAFFNMPLADYDELVFF